MQFYEFVHNSLGIHTWDLPTLVVLALLIVVFVIHKRNQSKRNDEFEEELEKQIQEIRGEAPEEPIEA